MTAAKDIPNVVLGITTPVTVYTTSVKKTYNKTLQAINPGTSTGNWAAGPKPTKILDLLRIQIRFNVTGYIASTDITNVEALETAGGVFQLTWRGANQNVIFEKLEITDDIKSGEQDDTDIAFTALVGENI